MFSNVFFNENVSKKNTLKSSPKHNLITSRMAMSHQESEWMEVVLGRSKKSRWSCHIISQRGVRWFHASENPNGPATLGVRGEGGGSMPVRIWMVMSHQESEWREVVPGR